MTISPSETTCHSTFFLSAYRLQSSVRAAIPRVCMVERKRKNRAILTDAIFFFICVKLRGKLVSDWLALAAGVRGFDLARSSGEAHLASFALAPCNSLPVNPFTGQKDDVDCRKLSRAYDLSYVGFASLRDSDTPASLQGFS